MKTINWVLSVTMVLLVAGCGGSGNATNTKITAAEAGASQRIFTGNLVAVNGSQSTSASSTRLIYQWKIVSKPVGSFAALNNPAIVDPTFTADLMGQYSLNLTITDTNSANSVDTVIITAVGKPQDLVVIGNSLTQHGPMPSTGWEGSWGMAASSIDKDFAHLVAASIDIPLIGASNFSALERTPEAARDDIPLMAAQIKPTSMVVIQLGDNVGDLSAFTPQYGKLLDAVQHAQILICTSTWWKDESKDLMIKEACAARGGRYVFIGDIFTDSASQDKQGAQFSDPGVNAHPHDWSMARIADRIVYAAP